jgi:hypothetical protein
MTGATPPPTLPLVRELRPAQFALGGSALEWQGYRAACLRMQQSPDGLKTAASRMGPDASTADPGSGAV